MKTSIDIWCLSLAGARERMHRSLPLLSADERERAGRFILPDDAARFALCRATLRSILGATLELPPERLLFEYGPHGKPRLAGPTVATFNVAHTRELMVCAVSGDARELGVDVERIDDRTDYETVAAHFFSRSERSLLSRIDGTRRRRAFFHCWTRKEAYLKARGDGLAFPLARFSVSVSPDEPPRLLQVRSDWRETRRWILSDVAVDDAHACCVAVAGTGPLHVNVRPFNHVTLPPCP